MNRTFLNESVVCYQTVPSFISEDRLLYPLPLREFRDVKGGVESHMSVEILWMEVGALGSGLGESPG